MKQSIRDRYNQRLTLPGYKEALRYALYDTLPFVSGATPKLKFFSTPSGQGGKTKEDTNLDLAGSLSKGQRFSCDAIEIHLRPGSAAGAAYTRDNPVTFAAAAPAAAQFNFLNDVWALATRGVLRLHVGSGKTYLEDGPLGIFPPSSGLLHYPASFWSLAAAASDSYVADYGRTAGRPYQMVPELTLDESTNFDVELGWDGGNLVLPSTFTAQIQVRLLGILYRN